MRAPLDHHQPPCLDYVRPERISQGGHDKVHKAGAAHTRRCRNSATRHCQPGSPAIAKFRPTLSASCKLVALLAECHSRSLHVAPCGMAPESLSRLKHGFESRWATTSRRPGARVRGARRRPRRHRPGRGHHHARRSAPVPRARRDRGVRAESDPRPRSGRTPPRSGAGYAERPADRPTRAAAGCRRDPTAPSSRRPVAPDRQGSQGPDQDPPPTLQKHDLDPSLGPEVLPERVRTLVVACCRHADGHDRRSHGQLRGVGRRARCPARPRISRKRADVGASRGGLADRYRVIAPDLPGYGATSHDPIVEASRVRDRRLGLSALWRSDAPDRHRGGSEDHSADSGPLGALARAGASWTRSSPRPVPQRFRPAAHRRALIHLTRADLGQRSWRRDDRRFVAWQKILDRPVVDNSDWLRSGNRSLACSDRTRPLRPYHDVATFVSPR